MFNFRACFHDTVWWCVEMGKNSRQMLFVAIAKNLFLLLFRVSLSIRWWWRWWCDNKEEVYLDSKANFCKCNNMLFAAKMAFSCMQNENNFPFVLQSCFAVYRESHWTLREAEWIRKEKIKNNLLWQISVKLKEINLLFVLYEGAMNEQLDNTYYGCDLWVLCVPWGKNCCRSSCQTERGNAHKDKLKNEKNQV